ncbi:MAG: AAA family ATPase [Gemmatimonadota bacterium]|nr:AAA family ATPase [Gemmatimonadota bacterium]
MRSNLKKITLKGFKTIQALEDFEPGRLTALIGPNSVGKSNFISFFHMMSWALAAPGNLELFVSQQGGASTLLHDGPARTREIETEITLQTDAGENQYAFRLVFAAGDTLIFADERYRFSRSQYPTIAKWTETRAGYHDPQLPILAAEDTTARVIRDILRKIVVYQFHNTSDTARIRSKWPMHDNRWLKEDAANIAPVLLRLRENDGKCYQRIVDTIRLIVPFFSDFELEPQYDSLLLGWRERNSDQVFSVSQASDGMLRVMALVTLLLQPEQDLPDVLILDEPELGLHPYAINIVGGLIRAVSTRIQVILATQSMPLVDCFEPEDIVVVERDGRSSTFKRLDSESLGGWLENYSISELWEKNVLGGLLPKFLSMRE